MTNPPLWNRIKELIRHPSLLKMLATTAFGNQVSVHCSQWPYYNVWECVQEITLIHSLVAKLDIKIQLDVKASCLFIPYTNMVVFYKISFRNCTDLLSVLQNSIQAQVIKNPSWLRVSDDITLNNPDYHRLEQAAVLGIGNARSLAVIFNEVTATAELVHLFYTGLLLLLILFF